MAKTSVTKIHQSTVGDGIFEPFDAPQTTNTASAYKDEVAALSSGNNSFTAPTGATSLMISNGTAALTIKGATGDTGIVGAAGQTYLIPVVAGNTVVISSSGASTALLRWR